MMFKKKSIIILSSIIIAALGHTAFYHWTKHKFLKSHENLVQNLVKDGFTIAENSPVTFSGFPFDLVAHQDNFKAIRRTAQGYSEFDATNVTITASLLRRLQWDIKGSIRLQGLFVPTFFPLLTGSLTKQDLTFNAGFKLNEEKHPIKLNLNVPHITLKLQDNHIQSLRLHAFKFQWAEPKSNHIKHEIIGGNIKLKNQTDVQPAESKHHITFKDVDFSKFDPATKKEAHLTLPYWKLKIHIKKPKNIEQYFTAITKELTTLYSHKKVRKLTDQQIGCLALPVLLENLKLLEGETSFLKIESLAKAEAEKVTFSLHTFIEGIEKKIILSAKADQAKSLLVNAVHYLTMSSPDLSNRLAQEKALCNSEWNNIEIDLKDLLIGVKKMCAQILKSNGLKKLKK